MREFIEAQVAKGRYRTPSEYLRALIRGRQKQEAEKALEAKLLEALDEEPSEMTRQDWADLRREVRKRYGRPKSPQPSGTFWSRPRTWLKTI